ncbi:phytoene/squalene synthase family protein [Tenacibaculum maritimum]|uniref:phytoene/squalene synthase family protein n=1 Tax=Tenacibaculum maritimum TaxID=107401 RepID=UPI001E6033A6|nr:phytoene/squalene synthase family protein [Tenacibaculum maritimum]MCD9561947.1 phytoene/squalene synthase family protein [Tenacibaculum maritimum]MCD9564939.1 phytoene/squalene synthase family protein [Tenacibaculum maritimum]MCD9578912.1 phytoene/squalene synthase family protein [Tenacibaculum maritimum]MCD9595766.1 phytoene/squalene synthase family protein [Tenacibaculum maritimum]MCD9613197.1 phytoene/squalene synthase family protein [Tenacibaculum maritimum]
MKQLFDEVSFLCSKLVTRKYSTSFSLATKMLSPKIRAAIYNIYGFVRFADEIVDSFHTYDKALLLSKFEKEYYMAKKEGISLNPILNAFVHTVNKYDITDDLVQAFLKSMKADLYKTEYKTEAEYKAYIYGSADVVGLMCLKVFVNGNLQKYEALKDAAMRLGSAFQKVNFLRDLKDDFETLNRSYFPNINLKELDAQSKEVIIKDIETDFEYAFQHGILKLPVEAKFGVYMAYRYYKRLLKKLKSVPSSKIMSTRVRISNPMKINLLARSYVKYKLNLI